ncbi:spore germination protein GerW family protein [uncultured Megasphaera sp.]|uniref:GerW family sporulation protein n=1 Tax=uncultured Megasphaera sp. TaxID=165188 RepID=UPI00259B6C36|nr:spore germination protein GerW family protein [uncultured Megasphaera sp.]
MEKTELTLDTLFEKFQEMIRVETVVGEAVHIGDAILVPFVDISFGFGANNLTGKKETGRSNSGGGGGAKMEPAAILVIKGDRVEMFSIKKDGHQTSAFEKLIAMAPEIIEKLKKDKYIYINDDDIDPEGKDDSK